MTTHPLAVKIAEAAARAGHSKEFYQALVSRFVGGAEFDIYESTFEHWKEPARIALGKLAEIAEKLTAEGGAK